MSQKIEGPDGTEYNVPDSGDEVTLTVDARLLEVDESEYRAPVLRFSFRPTTDRLEGFVYDFYPWEIEIKADKTR